MSILSKSIITGSFFLLILVSGYWLSHLGKPYNGIVFNLHKLIGLAAGIFLIVTVVRAGRVAPLGGIEIAVLAATVLVFVLLVAAGGLLSVVAEGGLQGMAPALRTGITWVHRIFPYLAVFATAITLYLLVGQR